MLESAKKKHSEQFTIDAKMVKQIFDEETAPWCKENRLKILILDNESNFHRLAFGSGQNLGSLGSGRVGS